MEVGAWIGLHARIASFLSLGYGGRSVSGSRIKFSYVTSRLPLVSWLRSICASGGIGGAKTRRARSGKWCIARKIRVEEIEVLDLCKGRGI